MLFSSVPVANLFWGSESVALGHVDTFANVFDDNMMSSMRHVNSKCIDITRIQSCCAKQQGIYTASSIIILLHYSKGYEKANKVTFLRSLL